jgi:ubiquinone/menaquinone biosynthesis C-methylase UbiE
MSATQVRFDRDTVERLKRLYRTRDILRRRQLVRSALAAGRGNRVLDVGCGPGFYITELLPTLGPEGAVVGVDPSRDMLTVAAERAGERANVELLEGSATALPVASSSFDRALAVQVLEYVHDIPAALREIRRALRAGGRLVAWDIDWATVSWHALSPELMRRVLAVFDNHVVHPSVPQKLYAQLRDAGFDRIEMDAYAFATNELTPDAYGGSLVEMVVSHLAGQGGISSQDIEAWHDEQRQLAARGRFFFSVTQFCFTATALES